MRGDQSMLNEHLKILCDGKVTIEDSPKVLKEY